MRRVLIAAVLACASVAGAQPAPTNKEKAEAVFADGQKNYAAGDYAGAATKFEVAYALDPDPAYLFNIAQAYRFGNSCAKASLAYKKFLVAVPDAPNATKVKQFIDQSDDCAKKQPPIPDTSRPPPERTDVVQPPPPPPSLLERPATHPGRTQRIAGVAVGGLGLVGVGIAAYFTFKASDVASQREALCKQELADTGMCAWTQDREDRETDLNKKGDHAQLLARISWGVGGAALVGGLVLYLLAPSATEHSAVTIVPSQGGAMALGTLRF